MGESAGYDQQIMPFIDACSIACGGHIGTVESMSDTIDLALKNNVLIGAHPSYPDPDHFGRVELDIPDEELIDSLQFQIRQMDDLCNARSVKLHHIKAHGALYNKSAAHRETALLLAEATKDFSHVPLFVPWNTKIHTVLSSLNRPFVLEAFADRRYDQNGLLVSRGIDGSVLLDPHEIKLQIQNIHDSSTVASLSGQMIVMHGNTFCIHGDNPNALKILEALNS